MTPWLVCSVQRDDWGERQLPRRTIPRHQMMPIAPGRGYKVVHGATQDSPFCHLPPLSRMSSPDHCGSPGISDALEVRSLASTSSNRAASPAPGAITAFLPSIAECKVVRVRPKRAPNSFILYKNDLRKRYPEIYDFDLGPDQLLRVIARMWENESAELRTAYEARSATGYIHRSPGVR